jgi:hypothetical protein
MSESMVLFKAKEHVMPDLDVLDQGIPPGWHTPYRLLAGQAEPQEVAHATLGSLSWSLRKCGGLPQAAGIQDIVDRVATGHASAPEAMRDLRTIEGSNRSSRHVRIATKAAAGIIARLSQGHPLADNPARILAREFCWALIDHCLFGRARPRLVGTRFAELSEAHSFERSCKEILSPLVDRLADDLSRNPTAVGLRAPRMPRLRQRSTAELMNEPILI